MSLVPGGDRGSTVDLVTFELIVPERHASTLLVDLSGPALTDSTEKRLSLGRPQWKPITREQVEALIGRVYTKCDLICSKLSGVRSPLTVTVRYSRGRPVYLLRNSLHRYTAREYARQEV